MKNKTNQFSIKTAVLLAVIAVSAIPAIASAELTTTMKVGARSADVTELQTFLAQDNTIYPQGIVSGYFGSLTKSAVSNFQARYNLGRDGIVGPMTRAVINQQMAGGMGNSGNAPVISPVTVNPSKNNASISWTTNTPSQGIVYYNTSPLSTYEYENSVTVSGMTAMTDNNQRTTQSVALPNLQGNTLYYYLVYVTGQNGQVSVSWPATFMTTN